MTEINKEEPTDNEVLELSNHFKSVLDKKEKEKRMWIKKYNACMKVIFICYTIFRMTDEFMDSIDYPDETLFKTIHNNIQVGRTECSEQIHNLLPTEDSEDEFDIE